MFEKEYTDFEEKFGPVLKPHIESLISKRR